MVCVPSVPQGNRGVPIVNSATFIYKIISYATFLPGWIIAAYRRRGSARSVLFVSGEQPLPAGIGSSLTR